MSGWVIILDYYSLPHLNKFSSTPLQAIHKHTFYAMRTRTTILILTVVLCLAL